MNTIKNVIDNDYCIGCGACAVVNQNIQITRNVYGLKTAKYTPNTILDENVSEVCPFATTANETTLGKALFSNKENMKHDPKLGYYLDLYAGKMNDDIQRIQTSSGGLISWLLCYLLEKNLIDGVIHVKSTSDNPDLFEYTLSTDLQEILSRGKSRYYHVSFADIKDLLNNPNLKGRYVFIGVPCYIKALRLLCENKPELKKHILYFFALFCGHMKTSAFAELLSWQQGITPPELNTIDFRVKNLTGPSSRYSVLSSNKQGDEIQEKNYRLYGSDWGLGFFKPKACDWCDDVSGELADITFGDAWLPEYVTDSLGTNIVIVRDPFLNAVLIQAQKDKDISLEQLPESKIIESQAGNYRHRHEGLSVRIAKAKKNGNWVPTKRIKESDFNIPITRKKLYLAREEMAIKSHEYFLEAKEKSSLRYFAFKMLPLELKYHFYNKRLIKGFIKSCLNILTINFKKGEHQ